MKKTIRICISLILAAILTLGSFSVGIAAEPEDPAVQQGEAFAQLQETGEEKEIEIADPAETPEISSSGLLQAEPSGDAEITVPPAADPAEEVVDETEPEKKKIVLDMGGGFSLASDKEYLTEDTMLKAVKWDENTRTKYSTELESIAAKEKEAIASSVKKADDSVFTTPEDIEVYITNKEWKSKSLKEIGTLGYKLYLSDENGKIKEIKTEVKTSEDGSPAIFFKAKRIADILLTEPAENGNGSVSSEEKQAEAVDVSEHALAETEASDDEPLLNLNELRPETKVALGIGSRSLLAESNADAGAAKNDGEPTPEGGVTGDGMTIERVSVKWLSKSTGSEEPAGQGRLELETDSNAVGNQQFQLDFAISGKDDHEPGTVEIVFPAYIWLDRYGKEPGNLTLSVPEEPGEGADFAWKRVGDNIVITNVRRLSSASKVMIQGTFRNLKASDMVDKDIDSDSKYASAANTGISNPLNVTVGITTPNDQYISLKSNSIDASINTHVEAASATKSAYNTSRREYYVYHTPELAMQLDEGNMPAEFLSQLDDPSQYSFVRWYVSGSNTGSQPALMTVKDTFDGTVTHYLDTLHKESETINVSGRMLGVQGAQIYNEATGKYETGNIVSSDGKNIEFTVYDGYSNLPKSAYVWTAYKQSDFPVTGDDYSVTNSQTVSVTGWDDMITTTKEATASSPFRTPTIYTIKKVWDDNNNAAGHRPSSQYFYTSYTDDAGYHNPGHNLRETDTSADGTHWGYSWSDLGRDRKYSAYEDTTADIFRDHIIEGTKHKGSDEFGNYVEYDVWWYDREKNEYDSDTHTWTTTNKYKERHIRLYEIPFAVPSTYAYMNKSTNGYTYSNRMSRNDRALNVLRRGDDVIVSYGVNGYAQTMGYTIGDGLNPGLITSYGQKEISLELEDNYKEDVVGSAKNNSLLFDDSIKLTTDDAEIAYVILNRPSFAQYGQYGYNAPSGTPREDYVYYGWSFENINLTDPPTETLYGLKGGEWVKFAEVTKAGISVFNSAKANGFTVTLPTGVERVKTALTVPTADPADAASWAERVDRAGMSYTVGVRLIAKSQTIQDRLAAVFEQNDYGMSTLDNFATLNLINDEDEMFRSVTDWSRAWLHGRNHRVAVRSEKAFELVENDLIKRELKLHSKVTMTQQSNVLEAGEYWDAREEGLIPATESGTWYDLLPIGIMPDLDSIKLTDGDKITDKYTVANYKESGRILLVVKTEVTPHVSYTNPGDPNPYSSDITYPKEGFKDVHTIEFDSYYSWDEARLYGLGSTVRNVAAFETDDKALGNIEGWSGEPDDPTKNHNQRAMNAVGNDKDLMTGLDPDRTPDHNAFVYAGSVLKSEEIDFMAATELRKYVTRDGLGLWTTGRTGTTQVTVNEGGYYSYMLYVCSDGQTTTKDIIFLDTLDNYQPGESDAEDYEHGRWHGEFVSIDTSEMEAMGISPVIYYNTSEPDLDELKGGGKAGTQTIEVQDKDYIHKYLQGNGWTTVCPADKSTIKAIAVDIRKKTDGTDFELAPEEHVFCTVRMKSKVYSTTGESTDPFNADAELRKKAENNDYAYNNLFMACTQVDPIGQEGYAVINYNYTRVGIVPFEYKVTKVWDDVDNNDGKRPNSIKVHLLANGKRMEPDRVITLSESNKWTDKFEHVIQYDENGNWITYIFEEESADQNPNFNLNGYKMGTEKEGENVTLTNTYTPETVSVPFTKVWDKGNADESEFQEYMPESVTVRLMADGVFTGKTLTIKPDRLGEWAGEFKDLPKYANPTGLSGHQKEIEYTVEEVPVYRFEDTYGEDEDTGNIKITNTYWPYGYLQVSKATLGTTEASKDKEFTFTILLKDKDGNDLTEKFGAAKYTAEDGEFDTSIHIGNGDTFTLKDGDYITIADIPSDSTYEVIESETPGFELTGSSGTRGAIRAGIRNMAFASFTNTYSSAGSQTLSLKKTLEGRTMSRYQFRFELVDKTQGSDTYDEVIRTASADALGDAVFSRLGYTDKDHGKTFTYEIREVDRGKPGYTYDKTAYKVTVTVTDNGDGTMTCDPKYYTSDNTEIKAADIRFSNIYKAKGDITLKAWKQMPAGELTNGQFSFELMKINDDGQAESLQTKTNDANGTVTFDKLSFTEADAGKSYFYVLKEVEGADPDVIYDESLKGVELAIADNGDGTLAVTQTNVNVTEKDGTYTKGAETSDLPVFVNGLKDGDVSLTKLTTWESREPDGDIEFPFTLTLSAVDGSELPEEITVQKSEVANAKAYSTGNEPAALTEQEKQEMTVPLEEGGLYRFTLKAGQKLTVKDLPAGTTYQFQEEIPTGWTLTFDNVAGTVAPNKEQKATYTNKYEPGKAVATVLATKRMDGKVPAANSFAFELVDDNEGSATKGQAIQTLPNHASGFVLFDLEYDNVEGDGPDTYHYLIREVPKPVSSVKDGVITYSDNEEDIRKIEFDEKEYGVTVTVSKTVVDGNITLSAKVVYDEGGETNTPPRFINATRPGSLQISKAAEGLTDANKDAVFTFKVQLSNDAGMPLTGEGGMVYYTQPSDNQTPAEPIPDAPSQPENSEPVNTDKRSQKEFKTARLALVHNRILKAGESNATVTSSGTLSSTVKWTYYNDGTLIIEPVDGVYGSFAGVNSTSTSAERNWPWYSFRGSIKKVQVRGQVDVTVGTSFMFRNCSNLTVADLEGLYTTPTTVTAHRMFNNCSRLDYVNLQHFIITSRMADSSRANMYLQYRDTMQMIIVGPGNMYRLQIPGGPWKNISNVGSNAGKSLNSISSLTGSAVEGTWVKGNYNPSFTIVFDGNGATGSMDPITGTINNRPVLPDSTFESDLNFAGWSTDKDAVIPEYVPGATFTGLLTDNQTVTLYAVWMSDDDFLIHYEANGGYVRPQWQRVHGISSVVNMPTPTHPSNYEFLYWTTNADGTGERYSRAAVGSDFNAKPGQTVTLYAQFVDPNAKGSLTIEHYQQNADLSGYSLVGANPLGAYDLGAVVTPPAPNKYNGFITPGRFTVLSGSSTTGVEQDVGSDVTIVKGGVTVRYYYNRTRYTIAFDPNTGAGSMDDISMIGGTQLKLPVNRFTKENFLFVGWNTAADGSGTNYGDGQSVNSIGGDGETVTLYAQWFDLGSAETAEPTNGEYTVTCKANETIVFPQLPTGTHYTITEVQIPEGWSLKDIENESGTVLGAERVNAVATNKYAAAGKADIVAHKALPGETLNAGQFAFTLKDETGKVLQTVSNSGADNMEEVLDADGNPIPNRYYGTTPVYFDTITYDKQGVYHYTISEVKGSDPSVKYDAHEEKVTVYVTDRGDGRLTTQVLYDESGADFRNEMSTGDLKVSKKIMNATAGSKDAEFFFTLYLFDSAGNEITEEYPVEKSNGETTTVRNGGAVSIKGGESFTVKDLPHNSKYIVVESPADGYEQVKAENTEGTIKAGQTAEANIENAYTSQTEGGAVIEAKKVFENGTIEENQFQFRLLDTEMEEVETVYAGTDGSVRFSPLQFDLNDDGARKVFYIEEVPGKDPLITYDTNRVRVSVSVSDNGDGSMKAEVNYPDGEPPVFTNVKKTSTVKLPVVKEITGATPPGAEEFSFRLKAVTPDAPMPESDTVTVSGAGRAAFGEIKYLIPGTYEYTVTESGGSAKGYTYDTSVKKIKVNVENTADGLIASYTVNGKKATAVTFTNKYEPKPVTVTIPLRKIVKGSPEASSVFTFNLASVTAGAPMPANTGVKITGSGTGTLGPITFTKAGTYSYTLAEANGGEEGYTYDTAPRRIVVTVKDNGGELTATCTVDGEETPVIEFTNTYEEPPAPPDEPRESGEESISPRKPTPNRTHDRTRHYRSSGRRGKLRKTDSGYEIIEDSDIPLAKLPTGEDGSIVVLTAVTAAAAAVILLAVFAGKRRKKEKR